MVGAWPMVIVTSANDAAQGEFVMVHSTTTGPAPLTCVKVALGVVAFGLNVPVPPPVMDQTPEPIVGVLPPRPAVVPPGGMVWSEPTVAVVGGGVMEALVEALAVQPDAFATTRFRVT